jgi:peptidoglycan hydrolase CwlO-like protein
MTDTTTTDRATIAELMGGRNKFELFLCDRLDEHQKTIAKLRADHDDDAQLLDSADKYIQRLEKQLEIADRQIQRETKRTKEAIAKRNKTIKELEATIAKRDAEKSTHPIG